MGMILNASCETQHTQVFGHHFTLKPGQIKNFQDSIAHFLAINRRNLGFVGLPEEFEDPSYADTESGREILAEKKADGVKARCDYLRGIIYNNQVSMKQDLDRANIKADPRAFASQGEITAMEELVKYQQAKDDAELRKIEKIKQLEMHIGKAAVK